MYQTLVIKAIREERKDFKIFVLEPVSGTQITYKAGQYLTLLHPDFPEEIRRSYSILSAPDLEEPLTIGVKRIANGIFSRYLVDHAKAGDQLLTTGAGGFFTLPDNLESYRQVFLLAAGSGITPIFSLVKFILNKHPELKVCLIYSNRMEKEAAFKKELEGLNSRFPERFTLEFIYSNSPDLSRAHLHRELLLYFLKIYAVTTPEKMLAFTCGPVNYMRMCTYGFRSAGIPAVNIRKELFNLEKAIPKIEPPDQEQHLVTLQAGINTHQFPVRFPVSILNEARKRGYFIAYSCEAGRCGNCVAKCLEGEVWMAYNEVLTKRDLDNGLVLTCVGFPVNGTVTLQI